LFYIELFKSVNNVIKHAKATHLDISLIKDNDGVAVTIEDNGIGFDSSKNNFNGIGLKIFKPV
jgi:signal transduction histidine kinase